MRELCACLLFSAAVLAQSPEAARILRDGTRATLIADSPRPLDSAAIAIAEQFGIAVSTEDPAYLYRDDIKDVTDQVSRMPNLARRLFVPKGGRLEVEFRLRPDGSPEDLRGLLQNLAGTANALFPFTYRLDDDNGSFTLIPTTTRDAQGAVIPRLPLLDRRVTIPPGVRMVMESANMMAAQLSAQTGLHVSCCQGSVGGLMWGMAKVSFEAAGEPARSVLKRLIAAAGEGSPKDYYWLQRCDAEPSGWCFINLHRVLARPEPVEPQKPAAAPADSSRWFDQVAPKRPPKQ